MAANTTIIRFQKKIDLPSSSIKVTGCFIKMADTIGIEEAGIVEFN
jgi:hypothetical protein